MKWIYERLPQKEIPQRINTQPCRFLHVIVFDLTIQSNFQLNREQKSISQQTAQKGEFTWDKMPYVPVEKHEAIMG